MRRAAMASRRSLGRGERGQTATEYMMVVSVIVIAAVGATQFLLSDDGPWAAGFSNFNGRLNTQVSRGYVCNGESQCKGN